MAKTKYIPNFPSGGKLSLSLSSHTKNTADPVTTVGFIAAQAEISWESWMNKRHSGSNT